MEITTFERLTGSERCLVEEAEKVREHAYFHLITVYN